MRHFIQPVANKLGIPHISWHTFRHPYSTLLRANGEDPKGSAGTPAALVHQGHDGRLHAVTDANRKAQSKVVEMIVPKKAVSQTAPA
jgi:hypothetical protein